MLAPDLFNFQTIIISIITFILGLLLGWSTEFMKRSGTISADLAHKDDLAVITESIEGVKIALAEDLEVVKSELSKSNIAYQIRYSKMYEKSVFELDKLIKSISFLPIWYLDEYSALSKVIDSQKSKAIIKLFEDIEQKIGDLQRATKESYMWLPRDLVGFILKELIELDIEHYKIRKRAKLGIKDDDFVSDEIYPYLSEFRLVISEKESAILHEVRKFEVYAIDRIL
ncbi:hypothetical protein [Mannheimia indoligenes]|uniref:Uncharacterized protein n=1 Tax=Mannheimia indoligenes TaxID=3103145 RepID=A0ABU7ZGI2_9PAST